MSRDTFDVVCWSDPAIDYTTAAADGSGAAYMKTRDLVAHPPAYLPGIRPAVFTCKRLTREQIRDVRNRGSDFDQYDAAFVYGVVKVRDLVHPDGVQREWHKPADGSGVDRPIPDAIMDGGYFDEAEVREIGMVIWRRSFLAKRSGGHYPLPAISVDALRANTPHPAEPTPDSSNSKLPKTQAAAASAGPAQ